MRSRILAPYSSHILNLTKWSASSFLLWLWPLPMLALFKTSMPMPSLDTWGFQDGKRSNLAWRSWTKRNLLEPMYPAPNIHPKVQKYYDNVFNQSNYFSIQRPVVSPMPTLRKLSVVLKPLPMNSHGKSDYSSMDISVADPSFVSYLHSY